MNNWYEKRIPGLVQWSAVRNISGLVVERMLVKRYPELARLQRSCHSCHFEKDEIIPCGICSKCKGVLLFLLANKADPQIMKFKNEHIDDFKEKVSPSDLRLDEDEKNHSIYLIGNKENIMNLQPVDHVEKIHIDKNNCDPSLIPEHLRFKIMDIINKYTKGKCMLKNRTWVS